MGFSRKKNKPWIADYILELCDTRRKLKPQKNERRREYNLLNKNIENGMREAKQTWIKERCEIIDSSLVSNNSKKAYAIVKALTKKKQESHNTIQNEIVKLLTEEGDILKIWTAYCTELYNFESNGDENLINNHQQCEEEENEFNIENIILREEVVAAIKSLHKGKAAGLDNIPSELIVNGGDSIIDLMHRICSDILETSKWPEIWTKSIIVTIPKKRKSNTMH